MQLLQIASKRLITTCECRDNLMCEFCRFKEAVDTLSREYAQQTKHYRKPRRQIYL